MKKIKDDKGDNGPNGFHLSVQDENKLKNKKKMKMRKPKNTFNLASKFFMNFMIYA
jgi:hypothetical protein